MLAKEKKGMAVKAHESPKNLGPKVQQLRVFPTTATSFHLIFSFSPGNIMEHDQIHVRRDNVWWESNR